ncbi:MAG: hypothetical protein WCJ37_19310 [Syntrophus sp. (in: bacteria)]
MQVRNPRTDRDMPPQSGALERHFLASTIEELRCTAELLPLGGMVMPQKEHVISTQGP